MKKVNILVVDDRPEGILAVEAVLSSPNYNLVKANSGTEALKYLLEYDFAVILLDVQMPVMNGFETAAVIKTREKSKDIPIVFMSAINQDEQYVYQGYGVGAVDYLLKPFDPYILRSKVAIFVDIFRKKELIKEQSRKLIELEHESHTQEMHRVEMENLKRYQYLADSIPQIVFRFGKNGEYEYFNKVWFEYTGLGIASSRGQLWKNVIHPDDLKEVMNLFQQNENDSSLECECRILNKNGVFRWHLVRIQPERFEGSEVKSWLGTATDIEDRKQDEEMQKFLSRAGELLVSTLDYRMTLDTIAKLAVPYLADWCAFDMINEEGLLENLVVYHRDAKRIEIAKKLHDSYLNTGGILGSDKVVKTGKVEIFNKVDDSMRKQYALTDFQIDLANQLGDTSAMIVPVMVHGKILGAITFATAESGRTYDRHSIETAEELARRVGLAMENSKLYQISQEAIEVRNDFLSIASHELNTPITSLKLQLQMVKKSLLSNKEGTLPLEKFTRSVEASVKQVDRLINLVQILLDVSRIQSGKFTFNFEELNASSVVQEVLDRHKEICQNSGCEIKLDIPDSLDVVWDKTRIEQVITNLLTNAIKYAPGEIDISLKQIGEIVTIKVKDHGKGIPTHKLKTVFERFERVASNESVSGLGLGLYIVKQIVEGHSGKVEVESEENKGTSFSIILPRDVHEVPLSLQHLHSENHIH